MGRKKKIVEGAPEQVGGETPSPVEGAEDTKPKAQPTVQQLEKRSQVALERENREKRFKAVEAKILERIEALEENVKGKIILHKEADGQEWPAMITALEEIQDRVNGKMQKKIHARVVIFGLSQTPFVKRILLED